MTGTAFMTKKIFFALGTVCMVTVYDGNAQEAVRRAKKRVMEIHSRMNAYDANSEVARINAMAGTGYVAVSSDTFSLIRHSIAYSQLTQGRYDITARPVSEVWKAAIAAKNLPGSYLIDAASALVDYRDILLDGDACSVMLRRLGQQLDLGAIAKGYAADEVRRILIEEGVTEALINLGGTVVTIGSHRSIGIRNPFEKTGAPFAFIDVEDKAVVTSGLYEQGSVIDGRPCHHIVDPTSGRPSDAGLSAVTLIGDNAEQLDALSTAVFIMGVRRSRPILEKLRIEAIFVTTDGDVFTTDRLCGRYAKAG